jgi:hypothetical protein
MSIPGIAKLEKTIANIAVWMHLRPFRQSGQKRRFTPIPFVARLAMRHLQRLSPFGLIGDRPFIAKITNVSGKSFIIANVVRLGGLGVAIALLKNGNNAIKKSQNLERHAEKCGR